MNVRGQSYLSDLRRRAEQALRPLAKTTANDMQRMAREASLQRSQLELQNDQLRALQLELENVFASHRELCDQTQSLEAELREREARLSALLATTSERILILDPDGRIDSLNPAAAALFGYPPAQLEGLHVARLIPGFDLEQSSSCGVCETLGKRQDGTSFRIELTCNPCSAAEHARAIVIVRDVSERKQRGATPPDHALQWRQITDRIEDVFYVAEADALLYVSPAFERIFAGPAPERIWRDAVHPEDRERFDVAMSGLEAGEACDLEYRIVRADKSERVIQHRAFVVEDGNRSTGILTDVTEDRALEISLRQAQRMETLGMLASGIAHDFNNLLMGIIGCARMALEHLDEQSPAHAHVRRGLGAALRGTNISRQLLAFGRTQPVTRTPIDLDAVVSSARELIERLVEPNVEVRLELAAKARILADPGDIEQILLNLATNARDAIIGTGTLTLRTEQRVSDSTGAREVALSVSDTGLGMDKQTAERVFEPFFTTKRAGFGTGLGMPSVAALVRRLGGTIAVDTQPGRGTTFTLLFPVAQQAAEPDTQSSYPPASIGVTVLVVEPDPLVLMTLRHYLESLGYRPLACESHQQALERLARETRVEMLLVNVSARRALTTRRALALRKRHGNPRILYMSARPSRARFRQPGGGQILYKPFDEATLAKALAKLLARPIRPVKSTVLLVEDSEAARLTMAEYLESRGFDVLVSADAGAAIRMARGAHLDALVTDYSLPDTTGTALALELRELLPDLPVLVVSGSAEVLAPDNSRFLQKPFELARLEQELEEMLRG
jgi:two-component system, cell cycle sensor histidine kinase and response regulator CckA